MPTTPTYALRYPASTDTPDVPRDMSNLASDVDTKMLGRDPITVAATRIVRNLLAAADAQPSFQILGSGTMWWGPGGTTAPDTSLLRLGTNYLSLSGRLDVQNLGIVNDGTIFSAPHAGAYSWVLASSVSGDAQSRFILAADGTLNWGPGTGATDTQLYRNGPNSLTTPGAIWSSGANGSFIAYNGAYFNFIAGTTPATAAFYASKIGDSPARFAIGYDGAMSWGPGNAAQDVNLYRWGANFLKTDSSFVAHGNLYTDANVAAKGGVDAYDGDSFWQTSIGYWSGAPGPGISFSLANDTILYRYAAAQLRTNGIFFADGPVYSGFNGTTSNGFLFYPLAATNMAAVTALSSARQGDAGTRFQIVGDGRINWGPGTSALDTNFYRVAAGTLRTDGDLSILGNFSMYHSAYHASALVVALQSDTYMRLIIDTNGRMNWGPGGSVSQDCSLFRNTTRQMGTTFGWAVGLDAGGTLAFSSVVDGDTGYRWYVLANGTMGWGPGSGSVDTNLYRYQAGYLATDSQFYLRGTTSYLAFWASGDSAAKFYIGPQGNHNWGPGNATQDTNLYRAAAGVLKTDGAIVQTNIGTTFPSSPVDGQEYNYVADATNGVVWKFIYSTSTGKWRFVGGSPLSASAGVGGAAETTTSTAFTDITTPGPSIVLPFAGDYDITVQSRAGTAAGDSQRTGFQIGATAAAVNESACTAMPSGGGASAANESCSVTWRKTGISGTVTMKYRSGSGGTASYTDRWLYIKPVQK